MRQFDENTFNQEWVDYWTTLVNIGVSECFSNDFFTINGNNLEDSLKITPASITEDTGLSYPGALLSHIRLSTMIAEKMAKMISGTFTIDINSLRKVCSLMHLSKIEMFEKNDNAWEIEKRGMNYKFSKLDGCLKAGERSILLCGNLGIHFTPIEFEAMKAMDKDSSEFDSAKYFMNIMTIIIRQANDLAYLIAKERYAKQ